MPPGNWNPTDKTGNLALSNLNLTSTVTGFGTQGVRSTDGFSVGKYYWECTFTNTGGVVGTGITNITVGLSTIGATGNSGAVYVNITGGVFVQSTTSSVTLGAISSGTVVCIAADLTNKLIWFRRTATGLWNNSGTANPATGTGGFAFTIAGAGVAAYAVMSSGSAATNGAITANFGGSVFAGAVPSGFNAGFVAAPAQQYAVTVVIG